MMYGDDNLVLRFAEKLEDKHRSSIGLTEWQDEIENSIKYNHP